MSEATEKIRTELGKITEGQWIPVAERYRNEGEWAVLCDRRLIVMSAKGQNAEEDIRFSSRAPAYVSALLGVVEAAEEVSITRAEFDFAQMEWATSCHPTHDLAADANAAEFRLRDATNTYREAKKRLEEVVGP